MAQSLTLNRRLVLAARPKGEPAAATLRLESGTVPTPAPGQMLLRTEYLSLDSYMRGRTSVAPSYAAPVAAGAVMDGGTVAQVVTSHVDGFAADDWVLSHNGWQDFALSAGKIQYVEEMIAGLEAAPQAFIGLLCGENFGRQVIHVGPAKINENKGIHT